MRFLIVSAAILAYASAGLVAPLVYGVNAGDAQAAAIDATVAAQDHARAAVESHNLAAEQAVQHNTEALRYAAETSRDVHENAYWSSFDAARSAESALSGHAAAVDGVAHSVVASPLAYGHAGVIAAPYASPYAAVGAYGVGHYGALPYAASPYALGHAALGHAALGPAALGHAPLLRAW